MDKIKTDEDKLRAVYDIMRGAYNAFPDEKVWAAWAMLISPFPIWAIKDCVRRCATVWPGTRMPTVSQITVEARRVIAAQRSGESPATHEAPTEMSDDGVPEYALAIAREMQAESFERNLDPDKPAPKELAAKYALKIREILGLDPADKLQPRSKPKTKMRLGGRKQ